MSRWFGLFSFLLLLPALSFSESAPGTAIVDNFGHLKASVRIEGPAAETLFLHLKGDKNKDSVADAAGGLHIRCIKRPVLYYEDVHRGKFLRSDTEYECGLWFRQGRGLRAKAAAQDFFKHRLLKIVAGPQPERELEETQAPATVEVSLLNEEKCIKYGLPIKRKGVTLTCAGVLIEGPGAITLYRLVKSVIEETTSSTEIISSNDKVSTPTLDCYTEIAKEAYQGPNIKVGCSFLVNQSGSVDRIPKGALTPP